MNKFAQEALDQMDAALASSDVFHSEEALDQLKESLERWQRYAKEIETILAEQAGQE
jgi:hypothetical protein